VPLRRTLTVAAAGAVAVTATAIAVAAITGIPNAQPRSGSPANQFAEGWTATPLVAGQSPLENPAGIYTRYGYLSDAALQADGQDTKTEPDQNTYLSTGKGPGGPTKGYDYGRHFLVQGHEVFGTPSSGVTRAYLTRVNIDVRDPKHRVTLLSPPDDKNNTGLTSIDGSTYNPFSRQLLFTAESGNEGGVFGTRFRWTSTTPPAIVDFNGSMGRAGYEGIHNDRRGNLIIVEDTGGSGVTDNGTVTRVRQPNSFVYRFTPERPGDLTKGRLQALQILVDDTPITFHPAATDPTGAVGVVAALLRVHDSLRFRALQADAGPRKT